MRMRLLLATLIISAVVSACFAPRPTPGVSPISPVATPLAAQATPVVYGLVNGGMELPYSHQDGLTTISAPRGWRVGWLALPPCQVGRAGCAITCPANCMLPNGNCSNDTGCSWAQSETTRVLAAEYEGIRVLSGEAAAKSFVVGRMGQWWYYQTVNMPLTVTAPITFSVWAQAWQCFEWSLCSYGKRSDRPTAMHLRVGIDPTGGTIITSTDVVWSSEDDAQRVVNQFWWPLSVSAIPQGRRVTVYISTFVDWTQPSLNLPALYNGNYARVNNDLYLDDAALEDGLYRVFVPVVRR